MSSGVQQQSLLAKLEEVRDLDDPTAFVLLWTFFDTLGLTDVENDCLLSSFIPQTIDPYPARTNDEQYDPERARHWLAKKRNASDFDRSAVRWLKGLDRILATQRGTFETRELHGYDGRRYCVRPLNNVIATYFSR